MAISLCGVLYVVPAKKQIIRGLLIVVGAALIALGGCGRATRHRILTFFFEGVPPLDSGPQEDDTQTTAEAPPAVAVTQEKAVRQIRQTDASRHEPSKDCEQCHPERGPRSREHLVKSLPDLCYSCHTDYGKDSGYLHGPIAVGECVFCHNPHQSKYVHLQKAPQPDLCYRCHLQEDIESIANHHDEEHQICTECHDSHISSARALLKSPLSPEPSPDAADLSK